MTEFDKVVDALCLHSTHERDPWTVDRAFQAIEPFGDASIQGLIWAIEQDDLALRLLSLQVLRRFGSPAVAALTTLAHCINSEVRLVRLTAMETAGLMRASASSVVPHLVPHLTSSDAVERMTAAGNLLRVTRSEAAMEVLRKLLMESTVAELAVSYLRENEWEEQPPQD